jgi:type VI secretion system protein VasG
VELLDLDLRRLVGRLNSYCRRELETAAGFAVTRGHYDVTVEHLLLVFLDDNRHDIQAACRYFEVDISGFKRDLESVLEKTPSGNHGRPVFSPLLVEWVSDAWLLSSIELGLDEIRSGSLLATVVAKPGRFGDERWTAAITGMSLERFKKAFADVVGGSEETTAAAAANATSGATSPDRDPDSALARFSTNFTDQARAGKIDEVFCRDFEIQQMVDILGRRRKNNPICVGDPGVGKTAVVEGLAKRIAAGDVPDFLKDVELIGLDLGMLQAGAGVRGEFENRLKGIIEEVKASVKPVVLFIDEAHMMIGAGGQAGGGDAANLLKPALARGELRTIAATTWSEYKKYFEKDAALARRFQLVKLDEPNADQATTIMRGLRSTYEKAHGVYIRDSAVEAAAKLSARYISGRQLPDKAVDVLDTACARVKLSLSSRPFVMALKEKTLEENQRALFSLERDRCSSAQEQAAETAKIESTINALQGGLAVLDERWTSEKELVTRVLDIRQKLGFSLEPVEAGEAQEPDGDPDDKKSVEPAMEDSDAQENQGENEVDREALMSEFRQTVEALKAVQSNDPLVSFEVTEDVVGQVISDWTGVPLGRMVRNEADSILTLSDKLASRVIGQDHAIEAVDQALRAAKLGVQNPDAPMGVFLFVGPSGVGKTELATAIADQLFGGERFLISINMSEFQEKHTVSKLVGSPPGYVGYGEGGVLTEAVRQRPYSVVLLDEAEKADADVMNLFYQVFDKGVLADGEGRQVDFRNTIIVLTSNLAADTLTELGMRSPKPDLEELTAAIRPTLNTRLRPALLARMQVVPFYPLVGAPLEKIVDLKLGKIGKRLLESQKMGFDYSRDVVDTIVARCTEVESGARNIDHIVNRKILPELATELLSNMDVQRDGQQAVQLCVAEDGGFSCNLSTRADTEN